MKRYRAVLSVLAALALAGLSCEFLEEIQQDPALVQNPDLSQEQREATQAAGAATLLAETDLTQTAAGQTQTAVALITPTLTLTPDRLRTFSTLEAEFTATAAVERTATAAIELTATALARPNQPPVITKFVANFIPAERTTYYEVEATDPDGDDDELKYEWSNTNRCGTFEWDEADKLDRDASWFHPHPPCPDERFHPAVIAVLVTDEKGGQAVYEYTGGSAGASLNLTPSP